MSCKHGNWAPCDECDEEDAAWKSAYKEGYEAGGLHFCDLSMKHLRRAEAAEAALSAAEQRATDAEAERDRVKRNSAVTMNELGEMRDRAEIAEQRAEAMRKDFERQLSVRMPDPRSSDLVCPVCHERDFDAEGLAMHFTHYRCNGAAIASGAGEK